MAEKIRVLLIDDDPLVRHFLGTFLEQKGFEVAAVHDGPSGLEAASKSLPGLIILDHGMPGMDGTEVAMRLKAHDATKRIPVIILSGDDLTADEQKKLADIGVDEYIRKGVEMQRLVSEISAILLKHGETRFRAPSEPEKEPAGAVQPLDVLGSRGAFFKILGSSPLSQVGVMTIAPGRDSGPADQHPGDQIIFIINGAASVEIDGAVTTLAAGSACIIPAGARHHIYNRGGEELFLLACYAPPAY